jgi:UDP-glucose 4-epimerase
MTFAWVIGSGGLLGAALCRRLALDGTALFTPAERFRWDEVDILLAQFADAVAGFARGAQAHDNWTIYWAAGVGTMGSSEVALTRESTALAGLLALVGANATLAARAGALAFSSSAGAIYAGSRDEVITEETAPHPTTPYAHEKLRQEGLVGDFARAHANMAVLVARISTIYGPGTRVGKPQGLLAHIARSIVRNKPVQIYVPLDTIRDYIAVDDAATCMVRTVAQMRAAPQLVTKIIASEIPVTIAEIVSLFRKIVRRSPRVVTSANQLSLLYLPRLRFRSVRLATVAGETRKTMLIGIAELVAAERAAAMRSAPRIP